MTKPLVLVTEFVVRHPSDEDGADATVVTAKRQGATWTFSWRGQSGNDSAGFLNIDQATAEKIAAELARRLAAIAPLWQRWDEERRDVADWLDSQRDPT